MHLDHNGSINDDPVSMELIEEQKRSVYDNHPVTSECPLRLVSPMDQTGLLHGFINAVAYL